MQRYCGIETVFAFIVLTSASNHGSTIARHLQIKSDNILHSPTFCTLASRSKYAGLRCSLKRESIYNAVHQHLLPYVHRMAAHVDIHPRRCSCDDA
jgi:hypothetical protein